MAALAVLQGGGLSAVPRPEPPEDLTEEQRAEWMAVVNRLPADWFPRETHAVLAQYCRLTASADQLAVMIEHLESAFRTTRRTDLGLYDKLLRRQESLARAIVSLATKMRITQQASYHPEKGKGKLRPAPPWSFEGKPKHRLD